MSNLDAKGHECFGLILMKIYYKGDRFSLETLRKYPLSRCVIVPHITIRLDLEVKKAIRVTVIYPKLHVTKEILITTDQFNELREIYHNQDLGWKCERWGNVVYMQKLGGLYKLGEEPTIKLPFVLEGV